jgi:DNA-binding Lrp family transcriptional regulator
MTSENEVEVLKMLIANPGASNTTIAKKIGITSAGVGKIKDKLERNGIIADYNVDVKLDHIGLTTYAIVHVKVSDDGWSYKNGMGVQEFIASNRNIISVFRVPGRQITHILVCLFRNVKELDSFLGTIQSQLSRYVEIAETYVFSVDGVVKDNCKDLLIEILEEGDEKRMPEPVLFGKIVGEDE